MGQELIKRAVDASVFLINLTSALIKFVMTAELVPVSHQTLDWGEGEGGAVNVRDSSSQQISQWSTANIIPPSHLGVTMYSLWRMSYFHEKASALFGVWQESPFKRRGFTP